MKRYTNSLVVACIITGLIMIYFDKVGWGWAIGLGFLMHVLNEEYDA